MLVGSIRNVKRRYIIKLGIAAGSAVTASSALGKGSQAPENQTFLDKAVQVIGRALVIGTGPARITDQTRLVVSNNKGVIPDDGNRSIVQIANQDGISARVLFDGYGAHTVLSFRRAEGTAANPKPVKAGAEIGAISSWGFGSTKYNEGPSSGRANLKMTATETWSDSAQGTEVTVETCAKGTAEAIRRLQIADDGSTRPGVDNAYALGGPEARWSQVWGANGMIQTSDRREKQVVGQLTFAGAMIDRINPILFRWNNGGYSVRAADTVTGAIGDSPKTPSAGVFSRPGERIHAGFLAQDLKAAMDGAGIDFGAWGLEDKDDPESRQWTRPDQLIAVLWAALKETRAEVAELRNKLPA